MIGRVRPPSERSEDRACCFFTQFKQLQFPNPKQSFVIASNPLFSSVQYLLQALSLPTLLLTVLLQVLQPSPTTGLTQQLTPFIPFIFLIHALGRSDIFLADLTLLKLPFGFTESLLMLDVCQVSAEREKQEKKGDTEQAGSSRCFPDPAPRSSSWLWLLCQPSQALLLHSAGKPRWSFSLL